jgi:hypothetical protein
VSRLGRATNLTKNALHHEVVPRAFSFQEIAASDHHPFQAFTFSLSLVGDDDGMIAAGGFHLAACAADHGAC